MWKSQSRRGLCLNSPCALYLMPNRNFHVISIANPTVPSRYTHPGRHCVSSCMHDRS